MSKRKVGSQLSQRPTPQSALYTRPEGDTSLDTICSRLLMRDSKPKRRFPFLRQDLSFLLDNFAQNEAEQRQRQTFSRLFRPTQGKSSSNSPSRRPNSTLKQHTNAERLIERLRNQLALRMQSTHQRNVTMYNCSFRTRGFVRQRPDRGSTISVEPPSTRTFHYRTQVKGFTPVSVPVADIRAGLLRGAGPGLEIHSKIIIPLVSPMLASKRTRSDCKTYATAHQPRENHVRSANPPEDAHLPALIFNSTASCEKRKPSSIPAAAKNRASEVQPKTPARCHLTKRVLFSPRPEAAAFPLIIINTDVSLRYKPAR